MRELKTFTGHVCGSRFARSVKSKDRRRIVQLAGNDIREVEEAEEKMAKQREPGQSNTPIDQCSPLQFVCSLKRWGLVVYRAAYRH